MKWLALAMIALVASVAIALFALPDPGYVLIGYGHYSIETSLVVFVLVLFLAYLALRVLAGFWHVPGRLHRWEQGHRVRRLQKHFDEAVMDLSEGRLERAERRLLRIMRFGEAPLAVYLSAARAAQQLAASDRRDRYLELAQRIHPQAETTIAIEQAGMQLAQAQSDQAQTTLARLRKLKPHSEQLLRLLMQLYLQQQDWQSLRELLPDLRRHNVLSDKHWQRLAIQVYRERILELSAQKDAAALQDGWKQLPVPVQKDEGMLAVYLEQLLRLGAHRHAEHIIREHLKHTWNPRLVYLFGELEDVDSSRQQSLAERWLEKRPGDPVLLLTLGKISMRNQLWGKARSYLENSIAGNPCAEAYRRLGALLEQLEEPDKAAECYRKGVQLGAAGADTSGLPAPSKESTSEGEQKVNTAEPSSQAQVSRSA